jgi:hypothetical protein
MGAEGGSTTGVMTERGYYADHAATQRSASTLGVDLVEQAIGDVAAEATASDGTPAPWRIADLGCAQGHNSMPPMNAAVAALRKRDGRDIQVVHTDLPGNDWATFFDNLDHDPASYRRSTTRIYPTVVGCSFYQRVVPAGALSMAWSSSSLHWLSASPGPVGDHFFVQMSTDRAAIERYRQRSRQDWLDFLSARSVELRPTASVVLVDVLMGDDGSMGAEPLFQTLEDAVRARRDAGDLTVEEYRAVAYPTWFRDLAELRAPFAPVYSGPDGSTLELVTLTPVDLPDPFLTAYRADHDAARYAGKQAGFLRGFLEPSFRAALAARPAADQTRLLDELFADAAARIAADPDGLSPHYRLVTVRIRRTA